MGAVGGGDGLLFPYNLKIQGRGVAESVRQADGDGVFPLLVDPQVAAVSGLEEGEAVAGLDETFLEDLPAVAPFRVVAEAVDVACLGERETVEMAVENRLAVDAEDDVFHAVDVRRPVHVVVATDGQADLAPRLEAGADAGLAVDGRRAEFGLPAFPVDDAFPRPGHQGEGVETGRTAVVDAVEVEIHRVHRFLARRVADLEVEVGAARAARIATQGDHLVGRDGQLVGLERHVDVEAFQLVLFLFHVIRDSRAEAKKMPVDRRDPLRVVDVKRVAITPRTDGDARDVALADGVDLLAHDAPRLEIQSGVEMVAPELAEIRAQRDGVVERVAQLLRPEEGQGQKREKEE